MRSPLILLVSAVALVAVACGSAGVAPNAQDGRITEPIQDADPGECTPDPVRSSPEDVRTSGLDWIFGDEFEPGTPAPLLERTRIVPVLRADGIPAIDSPKCVPTGAVDFLTDNAPVVAIEVNGDARGYPLEILTWHELVNDTIGGEPITISYCPLCNSAIAYDRRVGDRILDFGTSGSLTQSSMVMYDRQTETLWTHFDGTAVAGELAGERLEFLSSAVVSWADFRERFPDGLVLSRDTGFDRDYGLNPYPGYEDDVDPIQRFITDAVDPRLPAKDRVIGLEADGAAVAVRHSDVFDSGVVALDFAGRPVTVWNQPGTASAIEGVRVSGGIDVGSTAVFVAEADGRALTFSRTDDGFVDDQTGSTWSIFGFAEAGELSGTQLEAVTHLDTFWFA
ncbi:MAG: DUF3179 domain-containing protein, partial [Actinomycetota bacterium]